MAEKRKYKPIPLSMRGKKRYILFRLIPVFGSQEISKKHDSKTVFSSILKTFESLFGQKGVSEQRLWLVKWFPNSMEGIIRCSLKEEENVKAGLLFLNDIGMPVMPIVLKVSGSIKKLKSAAK